MLGLKLNIKFDKKIKTMKKIIYLFLAILIFATSSGFKGCNVTQGEYGINLIYFIFFILGAPGDGAESHGIAVGENGKIYTSVGRPPAPWVERPSGTTQNLNGIKAGSSSLTPDMGVDDSSVAYTVGNNGTVLRSTDRGHTWVNRSIPNETIDLYGVGTFFSHSALKYMQLYAVIQAKYGVQQILEETGNGIRIQ